MVATRYLKYALIFVLLPTELMALPIFESGICTHVYGLDQTTQVKKPVAAGPNAIQDARSAYIDRFGKPTFENSRSNGLTLTWARAGDPVAQNVTIQIVQGDLYVTCALTF